MFKKYQSLIAAFAAGLVCVLGFAPFGLFPVPVLALAVLFVLWARAATPRAAGWLGFAFGFGLFTAGIGWIYVALHDYGGMPLWLALPATLLFAAFLALFPALAGFVQARFPAWRGAVFWSPEEEKRPHPDVTFRIPVQVALGVLMPAAWVLVEWVRGLIFTGFPWLTLGYAHSDSSLAGYAPVLGVYGVSLVAAVSAGLLTTLWLERWNRQGRIALAVLVVLWVGGAALRSVAWTQPQGEPFGVALVQGNIAQDIKFNQDALVGTLETYRRLVTQGEARLTVLPETAFPLLREEVPPSLVEQLRQHARMNDGDMLVGAFEHDEKGFYNSVFTLGSAEEQHYRKEHLVPFGEFIPLRYVLGPLINDVLNIPMGDLARGGERQKPLEVAGQRVAVNICYEDVFGEEIIRALPQATLLVNVTNDAWYGDSYAAEQHNQIAQLRALETGRMMLRATNTGVTSIIGADGKVLKKLPQHEEGVLSGTAQGYEGITPYVRLGNTGVVLLLIGLLAYAWMRREPLPEKGTAGEQG
ncbi:apolipoprotein N-acyltransferase [Ferrigenium kumadai]|uniref:Apolipoprotein N-acyltransferase n=1 Tax=Ferrigenium kumadai TaxID=1682490 RepID=A0AAN1T258_9PROT|nr:apolipoprotein N-acyltransferase [Ferrigenium kumadai]BBJ00285.1 apolipoprotein N-acyltransferase [Ferrigenium kumadai]